MTEDGHISNCFVRQTILYMTVFGHIRSAFFKCWEGSNSKVVDVRRQSCMGHQILYCLMKKYIFPQNITTVFVFSVRQDFNGCDCADPQRPLQEIVGFILVYETKAKFVAGKLCVK